MLRIGLRLLALVVAIGFVIAPVLAGLSADDTASGPDPVRITDYDATFRVRPDGVMLATEKLTTEFPSGRHGIFRYWDVRDPSDDHVRLDPEDVEVTLDGQAVPVELFWERGRRYRVAKVGDADTFVSPGSHVYAITYAVAGVLSPTTAGQGELGSSSWTDGEPAESVFYWNVVAPGWGMSIDSARILVQLPAAPGHVQCATGIDTASSPSGSCDVETTGNSEVTVETGALAPRTPVTVRIGQPVPAPDRDTVPWPVALDRALGTSVTAVVVVAVLTLAAVAAGYLLDRRAHEPEPGFGLAYEPPPGLGPVQTAYLTTETAPERALVATLLHQAEQGLTTLTQQERGRWTVTGAGDATDWAATDDVTRYVGETLGVTEAGATFTAQRDAVSSGETLQTIENDIDSVTQTWAEAVGAQRSAPVEKIGRRGVVVAAVLFAVASFTLQGGVAMYPLPLAGFVVGGAGLLTQGVGRRRTKLGRQLWSHAGGFRRLLSTDSAIDRFDFSGREDLYTSFIPYAVAFDCADRWAQRYEVSTGRPAPVPVWFPAGSASTQGTSLVSGGAFSSFESSLSSSISAYAATQSSSSSGGGFSGGGGGGGGGGGSW
jgi:uncharacterized membrane protein YgcG